MVIVSTKNMIFSLPSRIFLNRETIINLVGFRRIFTDFGFIGRWFFNTVVKIYSLNSSQAFIVEHTTDKKIIQKLTKKSVFTTHGSRLGPSCFSKTTRSKNN